MIFVDSENLKRLKSALDDLEAKGIAVPGFESDYLERGHAVRFRCQRADVAGLRIDLMSKMRGVEGGLAELWERRTTIETEGEVVDLLGLDDLVRAKKTQRDKDWPMIRRLVEQSYFRRENGILFWLAEMRSPELLIDVAASNADVARQVATRRPAVAAALAGKGEEVARLLEEEERLERRLDREYWDPLERELEVLRRTRNR